MDDRIARLKTPEGAEQFATNVENMGLHELALAARRRAVELCAEAHAAMNDVERECLEAVYAYERARTTPQRKFHASRTWQMIERRGIIAAVEQVVSRADYSIFYERLSRPAWRTRRSRLWCCATLRHSARRRSSGPRPGWPGGPRAFSVRCGRAL
jgi:hypothetical protein